MQYLQFCLFSTWFRTLQELVYFQMKAASRGPWLRLPHRIRGPASEKRSDLLFSLLVVPCFCCLSNSNLSPETNYCWCRNGLFITQASFWNFDGNLKMMFCIRLSWRQDFKMLLSQFAFLMRARPGHMICYIYRSCPMRTFSVHKLIHVNRFTNISWRHVDDADGVVRDVTVVRGVKWF